MSRFGYGFGYNLSRWSQSVINYVSSKFFLYKERVTDDGGTVSDLDLLRQYYNQLPAQDSVKFGWFGESGSIIRDDGIYDTYSKIYDLSDNNNDGTQTTESLQPYVTGNIAPSTNEGMKNPNGDSRYIEHPTISFAADESWCATTVLNWNGTINSNSTIFSNTISGGCVLRIKQTSYNFVFISSTGGVGAGSAGVNNKLIGRNKILTVVAAGNGTLDMYIDGFLIETITATATDFDFAQIIRERNTTINVYYGTISAHIIRAEALTADQVLAEANFLQSIYPEIPSIEIGTQTWATENCEMITTPMENVIDNVTDAAIWATSQTLYDNAITAGSTVYEATQVAAMWCYYDNDTEIGSVYGKLYNWFAVSLLQQDITLYNAANPDNEWGWHIPTMTEFTTLQTYLGGSSTAGGMLKLEGTNYWTTPNTGASNSSGVSLLGCGYRDESSGAFTSLDGACYLWGTGSYSTYCLYDTSTLTISTEDNSRGMSLRLIKDYTTFLTSESEVMITEEDNTDNYLIEA